MNKQELLAEVEGLGLHSIRYVFADQHGTLRGKSLATRELSSCLDKGVGITSALLMKDTGQKNVFPVWADGASLGKPWLTGAGDVIMKPDPATFRVLPWADGTGLVLCDLESPDGAEVELSTRSIARKAELALSEAGYEFTAGLEIEFHLYPNASAPLAFGDNRPAAQRLDLSHSHPGWIYLGEDRFDTIEPYLEILRSDLTKMGLEPRSLEIELGPSQVEMTFSPTTGLDLADQAILVRSAVKQIARRHGLHASFMGRPGIADSFSSGWHLHQSLVASGENLFVPVDSQPLSETGRHWVTGLLEHASESCVLTTPTVTGYKRYRPDSLAPDRVAWAQQNRGAMLRIIGGQGDPNSRVENRIGDSAANPYLYLASQMISGLAGLTRAVEPPPMTTAPYKGAAGPQLPRTLDQAIGEFERSNLYRRALGDEFVDYLATLKRAEWDRFMATVTDWEHNEYFELF